MEITENQKPLIRLYAKEFEHKYLLEKSGQKHIAFYKKERDEVRQYWNEIKAKKNNGLDVSDDVLKKLLPYRDTKGNRERGVRISIAPAITKDLKTWFENSGWQKNENWPKVGNALYVLFHSVIEKKDYAAFKQFEDNRELSIGIKKGFVSGTLACLDDSLRIINNKTKKTINFIYNEKVIGPDLTNYKIYVDIIDQTISNLGIPLFQDKDTFDCFCHFMCDKRLGGYANQIKKDDSDEENEDVADPESELTESLLEVTGHWEAINIICKLGRLLGYKVFVADPNREAFGEKLETVSDLREVPYLFQSLREANRIDCIWYKHSQPFCLFEVEDGGTMRDALHRLFNANMFDAKFYVVCPKENFQKFEKWVSTSPYNEFRHKFNFRTYEDLVEMYKEAQSFYGVKDKFLGFN